MTESSQFLEFDFKTYKPGPILGRQQGHQSNNQRIRFSISSVAAKAEVVFRAEGSRIQAQYLLTGGIATKALKVTEANEAVTIGSNQERHVERALVSRTGFRDEKSFQWENTEVVSIAEAPWVFEHAWDQLRRATSQNALTAVTVEFHDGMKVRKIAIARSKTMNSEADIFLQRDGIFLFEKRDLMLGFRGNQLAVFGIDVPLIGLVKFALDER